MAVAWFDSAKAAKSMSRYASIWEDYAHRNRRWARRTSRCESGGDPNAIGGGGMYRGAFQFMRSTWRHSPKTPGGDPIDYNWKTQAVVAVRSEADGRQHWPVLRLARTPELRNERARREGEDRDGLLPLDPGCS